MNETLRRYWGLTLGYWNRYSRAQKRNFIIIASVALLAIAMMTYLFSRTEFSVAYTDLSASDAAAIQAYLNESGIPFKMSADGKSIGVPTTEVTQVKIAVESQNLVQSGSIGYGIFRDNVSSLGMTENEFALLSEDAKAGEISNLLTGIVGIKNADVFLNLPEDSVFVVEGDEELASAAIVVETAPGERIDQAKIDTMYNLVSKSLPKLPLANITISSQEGELVPSTLANGGIGSAGSAATTQFEIKQRFEADIRKQILSYLGTIVGRDRVVVNVISNLNFDQREGTETIFTAPNEEEQEGYVRSRTEQTESITSEGGAEGGVPGTGETDVPQYQGATSGGTSSSESANVTENFELNQKNTQVVFGPYTVRDVAILAAIEPESADAPIAPEVLAGYQAALVNVVETALADSGRELTPEQLQSKISVISQPFKGKMTVQSDGLSPSWLMMVIGALAVLVIGGVVYFFLNRRKRAALALEEELQAVTPIQLPTIDMEHTSNDNQVRKQLESLAKKKPEEFVNLLRTWLADE